MVQRGLARSHDEGPKAFQVQGRYGVGRLVGQRHREFSNVEWKGQSTTSNSTFVVTLSLYTGRRQSRVECAHRRRASDRPGDRFPNRGTKTSIETPPRTAGVDVSLDGGTVRDYVR